MLVQSKREFIVQLGVSDPHPASPEPLFSALQFQPRLTGILALIGTITRRPEIFIALGVVQWWSVAAPRWNPFDVVYNRIFAPRRGVSLLPAQPPKLFAQAMAGSLAFTIAMLMGMGNDVGAAILQCAFLLAVAVVVFARSCSGASVFHALNRRGLLRGRAIHWLCRIT